MVENKKIKINHLPSEEMMIDELIKPLPESAFDDFKKMLHLGGRGISAKDLNERIPRGFGKSVGINHQLLRCLSGNVERGSRVRALD